MNTHKKCIILIIQFLLILSSISQAETEGGNCLNCQSSQQAPSKIEEFSKEVTKITDLSMEWVQVDIAQAVQTNQMDAGYPMGCVITSMLYTLKYGPHEYRKAYENIPGATDVAKLRSLAAKFSTKKSQADAKSPAFSEQYGVNPNDIPWMIQSLVPSSELSKNDTYLIPMAYSKSNNMVSDLRNKALSSLSAGKPIIAQLLFTNPDFSHSIVITGVEKDTASNNKLRVKILDPMTGKKSVATIAAGTGKLGDTEFQMLRFSDSEVISRDGFLLSTSL